MNPESRTSRRRNTGNGQVRRSGGFGPNRIAPTRPHFPWELPRRCIKLFSFPGDLVLDPFAGWGTTLVEAQALGRRWIGIEKLPEYCRMAQERLNRERGESRPPAVHYSGK